MDDKTLVTIEQFEAFKKAIFMKDISKQFGIKIRPPEDRISVNDFKNIPFGVYMGMKHLVQKISSNEKAFIGRW